MTVLLPLRTKGLPSTGFVVTWAIFTLTLQQAAAGAPRTRSPRGAHPFRTGAGLCPCTSPCRLPLPAKARQRALASALPPGSKILAAIRADLDGDQTMEWACLTKVAKRFDLVILEGKNTDLAVAGRNKVASPWHFEIGDVDGDGRPEILIGVRKKSPLDQVKANRPFFYNWDGKIIRPKWLGSRLARRFSGLALADLDRDKSMELYAIEPTSSNQSRVSVYRWHGFGFLWMASAPAPAGRWHLCGDKGLFITRSHRKLSVKLITAGKQSLTIGK